MTEIALRPWRVEDAGWYVAARDDEVFRWTTERRDLTVEETRTAIEHAGPTAFAVVDARTDELLGNLPVTIDDDRATIGYWVAPAARRRGVALHALEAVLPVLAAMGATTAVLEIDADNTASRTVSERAGFVATGSDANGRLRYERPTVTA